MKRTDDEIVSDGVLSADEDTEEISNVPATAQWDPKKTAVSADTRSRTYLSTNYSSAIRATNKIKNKYKKEILGKKTFQKDSVNEKCKKNLS